MSMTQLQRYRKAHGQLMDYWHEFSPDTQMHLDKKLRRLGL